MNISFYRVVINFFLLVCTLLLWNESLISQSIILEPQFSYNQVTCSFSDEPVWSNSKAIFANGGNQIYFSLSYRKFAANGLLFGVVDNDQVTLIDTVESLGALHLVNLIKDDLDDIHYSVLSNYAKVVKLKATGEMIWEQHFNNGWSGGTLSDSLITPNTHIVGDDGADIVATLTTAFDSIRFLSLYKLDQNTGQVVWKVENLSNTPYWFIPIAIREFEDYYQVFSYNFSEIHLAKVAKDGQLISSIIKPNPMNEDIFDHVHMDKGGNSYTGLNAWGYRLPKLNNNLDTVWYHQTPSPYDDEIGNRTRNIITDDSLNVYLGGAFRLEQGGYSGLLLSKIDIEGNLIWQQVTHTILEKSNFYPENIYYYNGQIWYVGFMRNLDTDDKFGAILVFNSDGSIALNEVIDELGPRGQASYLDFFNDQVVVVGSSQVNDTIRQHVIKYKINIDSTSSLVNNQELIRLEPYPNPTSSWVSIFQTPFNEIDELAITDVNGIRIVISESAVQGDKLNLSTLPNGIYFVGYKIDNIRYYGKIIKQ